MFMTEVNVQKEWQTGWAAFSTYVKQRLNACTHISTFGQLWKFDFLAEWILHAWIHIERNQTWTPAWNNAIQHDETLSTKDQNSNSSSKETHHWIDALFQALNKSFKKPMWVITIASRMQVKNTSTKESSEGYLIHWNNINWKHNKQQCIKELDMYS
jgi:hypothetical protein